MPVTDKFFAINIREYLALGDDQEAGGLRLLSCSPGFPVQRIRIWNGF